MEDTNNVTTACYSYDTDERGKAQVVRFGMAKLDEMMPVVEINARDIDPKELDRNIREQLERNKKRRDQFKKKEPIEKPIDMDHEN